MKKIFLTVILLAAIGGALYYYFEMKKSKPVAALFSETIVGKWKIDSVQLTPKDSGKVFGLFVMAIDSNYLKYTYSFAKDGNIEKKLGDSVINEKIQYTLKDSSGLTFLVGDSVKEEFVNKLRSFNQEHFTLMASDSSILYFSKQQ